MALYTWSESAREARDAALLMRQNITRVVDVTPDVPGVLEAFPDYGAEYQSRRGEMTLSSDGRRCRMGRFASGGDS